MSVSRRPPTKPSCGSRIVSWLFPPTCLVCQDPGNPESDLCDACLATLPVPDNVCFSCADCLPAGSAPRAICGSCIAHPPAFDRTFAAFLYAPPVDAIIHELKFGKHLYCARILGKLLAARAKDAAISLPDCFIPVPTHREHLQQRGFNQAMEITRTLSRHLRVPFYHACLERTGACVPQTALPALRRCRNPRGTISVRKLPRAQFVTIVDDVMTTGATVREAARLLHKAGVARVEAWVVARTHREAWRPDPEPWTQAP